MNHLRSSLAAVAAALVCATAITASAQEDHYKCYKIKDANKLKGLADLNSPQFGLEQGCKISKAVEFCVPATKTVTSLEINGLPTPPLPFHGPAAVGDRICYKIKCPEPFPSDQTVTDQFGTRLLTKFKPFRLCTPAVKGTEYCGDGIKNGSEDCDGGDDASCPGACQADCTCPVVCNTACCYVENLALPPDTSCFEYTGTPAQVVAFKAGCVFGSLPAGSMVHTGLGGPCTAGPTFGFACGGGSPNEVVVPKDSSCP